MADTLYLSRRNLQSLLNKLDRNKAAGSQVSKCTIIKYNDRSLKNSMEECTVVAVEDEDYYKDFEPGDVHPDDCPS